VNRSTISVKSTDRGSPFANCFACDDLCDPTGPCPRAGAAEQSSHGLKCHWPGRPGPANNVQSSPLQLSEGGDSLMKIDAIR
jgi:hypothetical protein